MIDRRGFLKGIGAVGVGSVFGSAKAMAGSGEPNAPVKQQEAKHPQVPRRKLGKTGIEVPVLSLGTNSLDNQTVLRNSFQWGVTYWDTAHNYVGGNSELTIGKFIAKNPDSRKKLFIVSKASGAKSIDDVENLLQTSLKKMNTSYIDLYFGIHGLSAPEKLTEELRRWVKSAKERKLIRFFGFSTHQNMRWCLLAAAKSGWIDVIMMMYNFRLMQDSGMSGAVDACYEAGVGLVAMKVQAMSRRKQIDRKVETKLTDHFQQQGFTFEQAKVKAVLEDERISSACLGMNNISVLTSNVAAVLDKTKLTRDDKRGLREYAAATCSGYCAGCAEICDSALPDTPYVSDIMRYLMYYNSYGDKERARELFAQIPADVRSKLLNIDYSLAERMCPQHIPIGKAIAEAVSKLA